MRSLSLACLVVVLVLVPLSPPGVAAPPPPPADFVQPQSATKPEPFPVKLVDQGQFDPALKGYFLPEGFKLEVVIDAPDTINPVGMTFAPDGTLYVMEWRPDPVTQDRQRMAEVHQRVELGFFSGALPLDVVPVLLAALRVAAGCLDVAGGIDTEPHVGPRRWHDQAAQAFDRLAITQR